MDKMIKVEILRRIILITVALVLSVSADAQYIGVTCGFNYVHDLDGPVGPAKNWPLYNPSKQNPNDTWQNWVEELAASGVDFVCPNLRGSYPNNVTNPTNIAPLVRIIDEMGLTSRLKIGLFDDNAASWTAQWNLSQGREWAWAKPMDLGDTNTWKFIYDYNYKPFYETVPDANRFKINGRPVIVIWTGDKNLYVTNMQGNASRAISYVRQCCKRDFGFNPFIVLQAAFFTNDTTCNAPGIADAGEGWTDYNDPTTAPYTLTTIHGVKIGATMPGFKTPGTLPVNVPQFAGTKLSCFKDPSHGLLLYGNLEHTRGAGALLTLVEGFTDWEEDAALFAVRNLDQDGSPLSYDQTFYDYPNQRINILRQWSNFPFPTQLKVEVENCDSFGGARGGNGRNNYYRNGNIAIEHTSDAGGGWDVGCIQAGEWFEWQKIPVQGSRVHFQVRVASTNGAGKLHFVIDGRNYPKLTVPKTGGNQVWTTIDSGKTFQFPGNSLHAIRLVCDTGGFSINYWQYCEEIPFGKTICLRSKMNNKWMTVSNDGSLQCSARKIELAQRFQLVDESAGHWHGVVALQSLANHLYVSADPAGNLPLAARSSTPGDDELFQWIDNGDGSIALRSLANYKVVAAASPEPAYLINTKIIVGVSESFILTLR